MPFKFPFEFQKRTHTDLSKPARRPFSKTLASIGLGVLLAQGVQAADVNTTGLAVTDTEVTVGILHSLTGTMAISETGAQEAEKLAIKQINDMGGILGRQIKII